MFIGRYYHTVESNGRISLPKTFRSQAKSWVITRGLDGGLFVFKEEDFTKQLRELSERTFTHKHNRDFIRLMVNDAQISSPDSQGRVALPEYLTKVAKIDKAVVIVGSYTYLEIWDRDTYHAYIEKLEPEAETIAESLYDTQR